MLEEKIIESYSLKNNTVATIRYLSLSDALLLMDFANTLSIEDTFVMLSGEQVTYQQEVGYVLDSISDSILHNKVHLVVLDSKKIIGNAEVRPGTKRKSHIGTVTIAIHKDYRGMGLGTRLLSALIREAAGKFKMLVLSSMDVNTAGLKVYESLGFKKIGTIPDSFYFHGKYVGETFFYLPLV